MNRQRGVSVWLGAVAMALLAALFIMAGSAAAQVNQTDGLDSVAEDCVGESCNFGTEGEIIEQECPWGDCSLGMGAEIEVTNSVRELAPSEEAAQDEQAAEDPADEPATQSDSLPSAGGNAPSASGLLPERLPNTGFPALALLGSGLSAAALALWWRRS